MPTFSVALRVDLTEALDTDALQDWLRREAPGWFGVREGGDANPHHHYLLRIDSSNLKSIRSKFVRQVKGLGGNQSYSMKICTDEEKYRRYMCKGEVEGEGCDWICDPSVPSMLYTQEFVDARHAEYWDENRALLEAVAAREAARGQGNMVEQLESVCKRKLVSRREEIAGELVDLYKGWKKPLNVFHARGVVNTVELLLNAEDEYVRKDIIESICKL